MYACSRYCSSLVYDTQKCTWNQYLYPVYAYNIYHMPVVWCVSLVHYSVFISFLFLLSYFIQLCYVPYFMLICTMYDFVNYELQQINVLQQLHQRFKNEKCAFSLVVIKIYSSVFSLKKQLRSPGSGKISWRFSTACMNGLIWTLLFP